MLIRALRCDESPLFRDLRLRALQVDADAFGSTYAAESARTEADWSRRVADMNREGSSVRLAIDGPRVVGMCGASITDDDAVGMIWGMFVEPDRRGSGVAAALLADAEDFLRQHAALRVIGRVADGNARAIAFYRRRGYAVGAECGRLREGSSVRVFAIEKRLGRTRAPARNSATRADRPGC